MHTWTSLIIWALTGVEKRQQLVRAVYGSLDLTVLNTRRDPFWGHIFGNRCDLRLHLGLLAYDGDVVAFLGGYKFLTGGVDRARRLLEGLGHAMAARQSRVRVRGRVMKELTEDELAAIPDDYLELVDVSRADFLPTLARE